MIPNMIKDEHIDAGIRDLVIDINRIPNIHTGSNCEGHEFYAYPVLPVKGGWMHFFRPQNQHSLLVQKMSEVCSNYDFANLDTNECGTDSHLIWHYIQAKFEDFEDEGGENLFDTAWSVHERFQFLKRAKERKKVMLKLWADLDEVVRKYISKNITRDIKSLPYRDKNFLEGVK